MIKVDSQKQELFKKAMGDYPTGVTIVTTIDADGTPVGLTVNSFASVSLDPTLILWSINQKVSSLKAFTEGKGFAVHILSEDQQELCKTFASKNVDRFGSCSWELSDNFLPVIEGARAVLQCNTFKTIEAGDHTILIGEVIDISLNEKDPMLYHRRKFGPIPTEFYS